MKVFLTSVAATDHFADARWLMPLRCLQGSASLDRHGTHAVSADPEEADIILFVESHTDRSPAGLALHGIRQSALYREHPQKCFVHYGRDLVVPTIPGIFPSIERRHYIPGWTASGPYIIDRNQEVRLLASETSDSPLLLASFVGSCLGKPVRQRLLNIADDRIRVTDTHSEFVGAVLAGDDRRERELKQEYVRASCQSRFVLCPAGAGVSSIRLFEVMEMGRAPVIISDGWVPPPGPDWDTFSIRVPEAQIQRLGGILREREPEAEEMGLRARAEWERYYSPASFFHTICQTCASLTKRPRSRLSRTRAYCQFARPIVVRKNIRAVRARFRETYR
jgi:hypothetical protein